MDDINYSELFGLEEGVNEQEAAEPAGSEEVEGVNEQEAAEPERVDTETDSVTAAGEKQTAEQNAMFASIRRKAEAERDAAIAKARQEASDSIDAFIKSTNLRNPYTKQLINSRAEYEAYRQRYDAEQAKKIQTSAGLNDAEFQQFVEKLPQVQAAKDAEARANKALENAQLREAQLAADAGIKAIQQHDPAIKSVQDLAKMPEYPQFYAYVQKGLSFEDAYKLTHYNVIQQAANASARQAALNNAGKSHMISAQSRGVGTNEIPRDVMEQFKLFNPDATTAEIRAYWARNHPK